MNDIEARIEKLERHNRRLKQAVGGLALVLLLGAALGMQQADVGDVLRVRQVIVEDDQKNMRGFFGMQDGMPLLSISSQDMQKSVRVEGRENEVRLSAISTGPGKPEVLFGVDSHKPHFIVRQGNLSMAIDPRIIYAADRNSPRVLLGVHEDEARLGLFGNDGELRWRAPPASQ